MREVEHAVGFGVADKLFCFWIPLELAAELHGNVMDHADAVGAVPGFDGVAGIRAGAHATQEVGLVVLAFVEVDAVVGYFFAEDGPVGGREFAAIHPDPTVGADEFHPGFSVVRNHLDTVGIHRFGLVADPAIVVEVGRNGRLCWVARALVGGDNYLDRLELSDEPVAYEFAGFAEIDARPLLRTGLQYHVVASHGLDQLLAFGDGIGEWFLEVDIFFRIGGRNGVVAIGSMLLVLPIFLLAVQLSSACILLRILILFLLNQIFP